MTRTKSIAGTFTVCICLCALAISSPLAAEELSEKTGLLNPFFAMDTGTKDAAHQTPKAQVEMLKELGYPGIGGSLDNLSEMLDELDKNGLKLFAVYTGAWLDTDKDKYEPRLKEAIKLLKGRDTILWIFVQSNQHKLSSPDGDSSAVEVIRGIADMADDSGLKVALYPHVNFWLERVEDAVRLAKKVNRKNVGVTFNLCHWLKVDDESSMEDRLKLAMPFLYVVTINGADSDGKDWSTLIQTLDSGTFDIRKFLKTLKALGYKGPIGLQHYGIPGDARENLKRSLDAWKKLSRPSL
jgi:sugar phosphate isomerase/epimerase